MSTKTKKLKEVKLTRYVVPGKNFPDLKFPGFRIAKPRRTHPFFTFSAASPSCSVLEQF